MNLHLILLATMSISGQNPNIRPALSDYIKKAESQFSGINDERKAELAEVATYIQEERSKGEVVKLTFICTHNSRRSHLSQVWAATAAVYYGLDRVETYSGGTEATAFNPRAVAALQRAGFEVVNPGGDNPRYKVVYSDHAPALVCFSKKYDDPYNPSSGFAAIMTCDDADKNCPIVRGANFRAPISYKDPKVADNTPEETSRYDERCLQIATEMLYLFSLVKNG